MKKSKLKKFSEVRSLDYQSEIEQELKKFLKKSRIATKKKQSRNEDFTVFIRLNKGLKGGLWYIAWGIPTRRRPVFSIQLDKKEVGWFFMFSIAFAFSISSYSTKSFVKERLLANSPWLELILLIITLFTFLK